MLVPGSHSSSTNSSRCYKFTSPCRLIRMSITAHFSSGCSFVGNEFRDINRSLTSSASLIAVDSVTIPLVQRTISPDVILVPVVGLFVIVYGLAGGLKAAYWSDLIQGIFIILLSIILIPVGLHPIVEKFGNPFSMSVGWLHNSSPAIARHVFPDVRRTEIQ